MKKTNPTPVKGYEISAINRFAIVVVLITIIIAALASACTSPRTLTEHHKHDYQVLEVGDPYLKVKWWDKEGNPHEKYIFYPSDSINVNTIMICECKRK